MSTHKTKEELTRLSWITELRRQGHRQCVGQYEDGQGQVCAMVLLSEVVGLKQDEWCNEIDIGEAAGLTADQSCEISTRNDGGYDQKTYYRQHTFAEIADVVEGWFHAPQ